MAKRVDFLRLPVKAWQSGDTVAAYRDGKVVRIPVFGASDVPDLAAVATSGSYADLTNKPAIPSGYDVSKGVEAHDWGDHSQAGYAQASAVASALNSKVDKAPSAGLYPDDDAVKLGGIASGATKNATDAQLRDRGGHTGTQPASTITGLAGVATSGKYADLADKPTIPSSSDVAKGVEAHSWGNHAEAGYVKTNTTYSTGTLSQLNTGTETTGRLQTAKNLNDWLANKGYVTTDTTYTANTGLDLSGTAFSVKYGTATGTATQGNDARLSNSREWTAATVSQAEAEAGTASTRRAWTAQRVRQAILGWWDSIASAFGKNMVNASNAEAARTLLGLGNSSTRMVGTGANTVAAGNDGRITGAMQKNANLSDVANAATARNNLGLGTAATRDVGESSGQLMEVGAFGLGVEIGHREINLDSLKVNEVRAFNVNSTSIPFNYGIVLNLTRNTYNSQLAFPQGSTKGKSLKYRSGVRDGDYEEWVTLISSFNLRQSTGSSTEYPMSQKAVTDELSTKANTGTKVTAGDGLTGGGTLAANRTISLSAASKASLVKADTAVQPNELISSRVQLMSVQDVRTLPDSSGNSHILKPEELPEDSVSAYFSAGYPGSSWRSAISIRGWHGGYAAWEIIGPAATSANEDFYIRSGINEQWNPDRLLMHSGNAYNKSEVDALISGATSGSNVWQSANTALIKNAYNKITFPSPKTLTLPNNPTENDYVAILNIDGDMQDSVIARNGKTIMGLAEDMTIDTKTPYLRLDYVGGSWRIAS